MEKTYQPKQIEQRWYEYWEKQAFSEPASEGKPYCIMLPPPNVTGTLHMGHGFQYTLMDALIRRHRMMGNKTLWQAGSDHAGIATQMVVERELNKQGITRHALGRSKFLAKVWEWREQSGSTITQQIRRMGASIDWSRAHFSMDESICRATNEAFVRLYEEGLIYRGKRLVNWDPKLKTALSDLEVTTETEQGKLWYIRYPLANKQNHLIVATTRPETLLGDTAVAVHPEDERYRELIGQTIKLPLINREIPIIADEYVDRKFGSGSVKITPAHDFNDYDIGQRHNLAMINIFTQDAHLNNNVPKAYRGMDRFSAREKIVADLTALNLIEKIEPHQHNIPHGDRSDAILEPMLTDQWFIKMDSLAKPAIAALENGELKFVPQHWSKIYLQWLHNIQDWCVSRQLWWGHQIPVWYDDDNTIYVGLDEKDVRKRHNLKPELTLHQDPDVLDTWFTASLWPFSSLGWPNNTEEMQTFYPSNVLVTGFDIIFFWVARMVMMGLKLTGQVPFKEVYITGLIRDSQGKKMSKTKGNILDPIDLVDGIDLESLIKKRCAGLVQPQMAKTIEKTTRKEFPQGIDSYGTDALRFTFCALASTGRDINFDMGRIEGYRNFCNKLWNAARYVLMNTEGHDISTHEAKYSLADRWIQSQLQNTIKAVDSAFNQYRFDLLTQTLYEFIWNEYCDWYLELSKCVLTDGNADPKALLGTRRTLLEVLETILRLVHPIMPFISEEIWQTLAPMLNIKGPTLMLQPYPSVLDDKIDESAQQHIEWLKQVVMAIRNVRGEISISPAKTIHIILNKGDESDRTRMRECSNYIKKLARVDQMTWLEQDETLPVAATTIVNQLEIHIPLAGLIDKEAELNRLTKQVSKLSKELEKYRNKLDNPNYLKKAPAKIVEKERERLTQSEATLKKLKQHHQKISVL